jgi:hypothetical protein
VTVASRLRASLPAALSAVVIAAAALLWHNLPDLMDVEEPFDVHGTMGEQVSGRAIAVTVTGARAGPRVQALPRAAVDATGEWLVVDAELDAVSGFVLPVVDLQVGPNTYIPSERFRPTQLGGELAPDIPQRGSWVFDVAPELLDESAPMALRVWQGDSRLDSRLVVTIALPPGDRGDTTVLLDPVEKRA